MSTESTDSTEPQAPEPAAPILEEVASLGPSPDAAPSPAPAGRARQAWARFVAFARRHDLVFRAPRPEPLRALLPRTWWHWSAVILLWGAFLVYLVSWVYGNSGFLFDPLLQNDDARTGVFLFHRYGPDHALANDPIANEMLSYVPPFVRLLYRVFVPLTNLFVAVKLVQGVALAILFAAGWVLLRARRGGLAVALLLIFFVLHSWFPVNRIAGGFPRSFAFPCFSLWIAGAIAGSDRVRAVAVLIGAATYPSALSLLFAAEGLFVFRDGVRKVVLGRLKRYGLLLVAAVLIVAPAIPSKASGPLHNLEQAEKEPAFGRSGRLPQLPFPEPTAELSNYLVEPLRDPSYTPPKTYAQRYRAYGYGGPVLFLVGLLLLGFSRLSARPHAATAFFAGTTIIYLLASAVAFRLYSPERYSHYGMTATTIALVVSAVGLVATRVRRPRRAAIRSLVVAAFIPLLCFLTGNGILAKNGMTIDGRRHADLFAFVKTLPLDVRIASHPSDGDDVPLWTGRAMMGGYETLQPWLVESWAREKARAEDTLRAMYATERDVLLSYCARYGVTHLLVRRDRYGSDFARRAAVFQPIGAFVDKLLANVSREKLVLADPPAEAVLWSGSGYQVVDVKRLHRAWEH